MKNIFLITSIILMLGASVISQTDTVIKTKDATISYFRIYKYRIQGNDSIFQRGGFSEITGVKYIKFLSDDSLVMKTDEDYSVGLKTNNIRELGYLHNNPENVWAGAFLGGVAGGTLGLFIGWFSTINLSFDWQNVSQPYYPKKEEKDYTVNYLVGGLLGTAIGCTVGALIGKSINYTTLDLFSVPDKDKKARLIKFLRNK